MGQPAARITDPHVCPMMNGIVPHVGGPILPPCCPTVFIGGLPAARVGDMLTCVGPPDVIAKGSATVFIGGMPAARMGDMTVHGGVIVSGCPTVLIGDQPGSAAGGSSFNAPSSEITLIIRSVEQSSCVAAEKAMQLSMTNSLVSAGSIFPISEPHSGPSMGKPGVPLPPIAEPGVRAPLRLPPSNQPEPFKLPTPTPGLFGLLLGRLGVFLMVTLFPSKTADRGLDERGEGDPTSEPTGMLVTPVAGRGTRTRNADNPNEKMSRPNISEDRAKHILDGDEKGNGGHLFGANNGKVLQEEKNEFPKDWSRDKILDAANEIADGEFNDVKAAKKQNGGVKRGTVDGVTIEVVIGPYGKVETAYPVVGHGVVERKPR